MRGAGLLHHTKLVLRVLGASASGLFAAQAVWLFANPHVADFWEGCHWLGQGLLGLLVGAAGCYLEVQGSMSSVTRHFRRFALNRIGLSIFYFWMGCYVMGGMGLLHSGEGWRRLAHGTGIVAWVASVGDLVVSCTSEGGSGEECSLRDKPAEAQPPASYGRSCDVSSSSAAPGDVILEAAAATEEATAPEVVPGAGGWSTAGPVGGWGTGSKAFGCP